MERVLKRDMYSYIDINWIVICNFAKDRPGAEAMFIKISSLIYFSFSEPSYWDLAYWTKNIFLIYLLGTNISIYKWLHDFWVWLLMRVSWIFLYLKLWCPSKTNGNNRSSSINQISLVHNHDKSGLNVSLKTTRTLGKTQVCE